MDGAIVGTILFNTSTFIIVYSPLRHDLNFSVHVDVSVGLSSALCHDFMSKNRKVWLIFWPINGGADNLPPDAAVLPQRPKAVLQYRC